ncbi:MAG: hypothetical protein ABJK28_02870 [Algibacter sp.]
MKLAKEPLYLFVEKLCFLMFLPIKDRIDYQNIIRKQQQNKIKYQYAFFE